MSLALFADVHGNFEALEACLKHARDRGAARYAFLGDLVGYGADPAAVVDIVRELASEGAVVVQGNHDAAVGRYEGGMSESAQPGISWARKALEGRAKHWLESLPLCIRDGPMCFVHASAANPGRWEYVDCAEAAKKSADAAGVPWTFCGHVHQQALFFEVSGGKMSSFTPVPGSAFPMRRNRRWVAIVGSVGQPRDRNPAAAYALFDGGSETLTFYRVPYDYAAATRKLRAARLPENLPWSAGP